MQFEVEAKLELSSFRGRATSKASHDSKRVWGAFVFAQTLLCEWCIVCFRHKGIENRKCCRCHARKE